MLGKLIQGTTKYKLTHSNFLPNRKARQFLTNFLRNERYNGRTSSAVRASMGLLPEELQNLVIRRTELVFGPHVF